MYKICTIFVWSGKSTNHLWTREGPQYASGWLRGAGCHCHHRLDSWSRSKISSKEMLCIYQSGDDGDKDDHRVIVTSVCIESWFFIKMLLYFVVHQRGGDDDGDDHKQPASSLLSLDHVRNDQVKNRCTSEWWWCWQRWYWCCFKAYHIRRKVVLLLCITTKRAAGLCALLWLPQLDIVRATELPSSS